MNQEIIRKITSLGIGATSLCNLNCPHCYSRKLTQKSVSLKEFKAIINKFPKLNKVNFGTGESILNKDFKEIIDFLDDKKIALALTTNGYTIHKLSDDYIRKFKDVDISLDFPEAELHDQWRGKKGTFDSVIMAIKKCKSLNIAVSIAMTLMNNNYKYLPDFKKLIEKYDVSLRINLYKPVYTKKYLMNYGEFWDAIKILSENFELINNSEPILTLVTGDKISSSPCGGSARLHPNGKIIPCVYLLDTFSNFEEFMKLKLEIPSSCKSCNIADNCRGGCLGRRLLTYNSPVPDQYCPMLNNKKIPNIAFRRAKEYHDFIHSRYLCTIIVR